MNEANRWIDRLRATNTLEGNDYKVLIFLLKRERDRKKEIRLEALALLEEWCTWTERPDESLRWFIASKRKELEGT